MSKRAIDLGQDWLGLIRLARRRFRSKADYRRFQIYQGTLVISYLETQGFHFHGLRVLDLGCGNGGYSYVMAQAGANVISLDFRRPKVDVSGTWVLADASEIPFVSSSFPFVFCASLIEHVPDPVKLVQEIGRVLTPDGVVYLSFPPFYSPVGGHQFKPYHLLGERWALRLSRRNKESYAKCYGDWGLYPLSIRRVRQIIAEAGLEIQRESTRFFPLNLARIPALGEFLTWHVQFIVTHPPSSHH
jgi:SAM-dependent methyltransferase